MTSVIWIIEFMVSAEDIVASAKKLLEYQPEFSVKAGLAEAVSWYWNNLK